MSKRRIKLSGVPLWAFFASSSLFALVIGVIVVNVIKKTPVGTPRVYTTFITDNSTATPNVDGTATVPLQIPDCATQVLPATGFFVFRVWTWNADKELFRADSNGGNICQLTNNTVADDQPSISPDGAHIAFVSFDDNFQPGIFIMNSDSADRALLASGGSAYSFPVWSPDGSRLIFQATIDELFDLYVINADGTDLRNLTNDVSLDTTPAWSSDGDRVAFASDRTFDPEGEVQQSRSFEIYVMNADGSNVRRLTNNERMDISPAWSPDNQQIIYVSEGELYVTNSDGTDHRRITKSSDFYASSPIWLPDGEQVAFVSDMRDAIYIVDIHSLSAHPLIEGMAFAEIDGWFP